MALDVVEIVKQRRGLSDAIPVMPAPVPPNESKPLQVALDDAEREFINDALRRCHGNSAAAARHLGIEYRSMRHRMKRLKIGKYSVTL